MENETDKSQADTMVFNSDNVKKSLKEINERIQKRIDNHNKVLDLKEKKYSKQKRLG